MLDGLVLVSTAVLAVCWVAGRGPRAAGSRRRLVQERREHLNSNPDHVNALDVELLLADLLPADGRPAERAAEVCRMARARRIPALELWTWCQTHDAELLALALEAGLTGGDLAGYLVSGEMPDRRTLRMLSTRPDATRPDAA